MPNLPLSSHTITRICHSMIFGKRSPDLDEQQWKGEKCFGVHPLSPRKTLATCCAPLPPGKKYVVVQFLNKDLIYYVVDAKGKGQEIFDEASKHLGLSDAELFGLAFKQDGEYIFIDLNSKVSKYASRSWKAHLNGISGDGQPLLTLHLRVQYYVDCHLLINEKIVRHHYYLQLRENVKNYAQPISEEKSFLLAALALQADLGNYDAQRHQNCYFEIANYFPAWVIKKVGVDFITRSTPPLHRDNAGLSRAEAQVGYIKEASDCTSPHNLHLYKMRRRKGKVWGDVWMGIADAGIHIYKEVDCLKSLLSTFFWCDIAKLHFEKKKFEILSEGGTHSRKFTYSTRSEEMAEQLFWMCRTTHAFHMAHQARVAELRKLEAGGDQRYNESYIYTDKQDRAKEQQTSLQRNNLKAKLSVSALSLGKTSEHGITEPVALVPQLRGSCLECTQDSHRSMECLPLKKGFSSELKYRSQSIPCLPESSLSPFLSTEHVDLSPHWCPTDSDSSHLSLASGSTLRASSCNEQWEKCDSFEEIPVPQRPSEVVVVPQKMCISTFSNGHVRTASVYNGTATSVGNIYKACQAPNIKPEPTHPVNHSKINPNPSQNSRVYEVRRSPSLNIGPIQEDPKPPYTVHKRQNAPHGRTGIKIGVSSLSRDQKLPLSLFGTSGIAACGSVPNLYDRDASRQCGPLSKKQSSQSEMSLNVLEKAETFEVKKPQEDFERLSLHDVCRGEVDFCIPPPPAYRNEVEGRTVDVTVGGKVELSSGKDKEEKVDKPASIDIPSDSSPDILDIHKLRQRSHDLELPLLSALCNDRSLLPKTVPTCSSQRHLGHKDCFSRATSLPDGDGTGAFLVRSGRPISWHVDSCHVPHMPEVSKPCSASWDYSAQKEPATKHIPRMSSLEVSVPQWNGLAVCSILDQASRTVSLENGMTRNDQGSRTVSLENDMTRNDQGTRTVCLENGMTMNGIVPQNIPAGTRIKQSAIHGHYPLLSHASRLRTLSLENGLQQTSEISKKRTLSVDQNNYVYYPVVNDMSQLRTMSLENGIHQSRYVNVGHQQNSSSDCNYRQFLFSNKASRPRTISFENGLHINQVIKSRPHESGDRHLRFPASNPQTVSLENEIFQYELNNQRTSVMGNGIVNLPISHPTMLTSFVKTRHARDHSNSSDSYRYEKSQMIPTKLLAGSLSGLSNGRLYQKGLSS